jgi:hypothetical protein
MLAESVGNHCHEGRGGEAPARIVPFLVADEPFADPARLDVQASVLIGVYVGRFPLAPLGGYTARITDLRGRHRCT